MPQDPRPAPPDTAERRQATVLFADVSGFAALSHSMDPEDVRDLMNSCFERIETIVRERGGEIDKYMGDAVMGLFGARAALERAAYYACDSALAIRDAVRKVSAEAGTPLDVHIGINTGVVVAGEVGGASRRDFTVMGPTVNMASRLEARAANAEILVGSETRRATRHEFEYSDAVEIELKGFDAPVQAYYLTDYAGGQSSWTLGGGHRSANAPFIGREVEKARLDDFAERIAAGRGGALALWGESGLGKSRMLGDFLARIVPKTICVHVGHSIPVGRRLSFHPFANFLRSWMNEVLGTTTTGSAGQIAEFVRAVLEHEDPEIEASICVLMEHEHMEVEASVSVVMDLGLTQGQREGWATMSPDAQERFVHSALTRLLQAASAKSPLLIVLEDLHWADDSSLTLLEFLLPLVRHHPIGFLLLARPGYEETTERVAQRGPTILGDSWEQITVGALTPEETRQLLRHLVHSDTIPRLVTETITDRAAGNPLFLEEIVEDLVERQALTLCEEGVIATEEIRTVSIPPTIEGVVLSRVDRLSANAKAAAEAASVVGREFSLSLLTTIAGHAAQIDEALLELAASGFLAKPVTASSRSAGPGSATSDMYEFRHALLQESIYQSLVKRRRHQLHIACARSIESTHAADLAPRYGTLAYHYLQAEDLDRAEDYLFRAGERAAAFAASREALRYFRDAYDVYTRARRDQDDPRRRALLEKQIGFALLNTGRLVESVPHLNASLRLRGERVPETPLQLNIKMVRDLVAIVADLYLRGDKLHTPRGRDDDRELFEILYNRCRAQNSTDPRRAFQDNLAAIRHMRHLDVTTVPHACGIYSAAGAFFAFSGLSFGISERFLRIARKLAQAGTDTDCFQYNAMSYVKTYLAGAWSVADPMTPDLLERGIRTGLLWDADTYLGMRAEMEIKQGRFDDAEATIAMIERLQETFGYTFSEANVLANRAYLLTERGELPAAWLAINRYYESREEDTLRLIALSTRARIEAGMGRLDDASESLRLAGKLVARAGRIAPYYESAFVSASLLVAVMGYEAAVRERGPAARRAGWKCAALIREAEKLTRRIARDRVQVYGLAGRYAHASGDARAARRWWGKAIRAARELAAEPDRLRLGEEIAACGGEIGQAGA